MIPGEEWGYFNADKSGSTGFEADFKTKYIKGYAGVSYSYYTLAYSSVPKLYAVPEKQNYALGLSPHKFSLYGSYNLQKNLYVSPSFILNSKRYAYASYDEEGNPAVSEFKASALLNISIGYNNLFYKGINLSASCFDLFNQRPSFLQPYNGWQPPYPGSSREFVLKLNVEIN